MFGTSHKSACLLLLLDQRSLGLIRYMFPNYNRLFDPNCKIVTKYMRNNNVSESTLQVWLTLKEQSDQSKQFIIDFNLFFSKKWAFVHLAKFSSGLLSSGLCPVGY